MLRQPIRQPAAALHRPNGEALFQGSAEVAAGDAAAVDQQPQARVLPFRQRRSQARKPAGFHAPIPAFDEQKVAVVSLQDGCPPPGYDAARQDADQRRWPREGCAGFTQGSHHAAVRATRDQRHPQPGGCLRHTPQTLSGQRPVLGGDLPRATAEEERRPWVTQAEATQNHLCVFLWSAADERHSDGIGELPIFFHAFQCSAGLILRDAHCVTHMVWRSVISHHVAGCGACGGAEPVILNPKRYTARMAAPVKGKLDEEARVALRDWFTAQAADLPWRRERRPYRIWLAEVMLMQTRVATVLRYYERFLEAFPDPAALAAAPLAEVLKRWEGLGYYTRARNLHRAARIISEQRAGQLPQSYEEWLALPGIGPYSAAAIASIASGEARAAVDGNVRRVLARLLDEPGDIRRGQTQRSLAQTAQDWLDADAPGRHNEALMELGQRICRPRAPLCPSCPLRRHCRALARGTVALRPVRSPRSAPREEWQLGALIVDAQGRTLLRQRDADERLGHLWTFPGGVMTHNGTTAIKKPPAGARSELARLLQEQLGCAAQVGAFFTQVPLRISGVRGWLVIYRAKLPADYQSTAENIRWLSAAERARASFGRAERVVLSAWEEAQRPKRPRRKKTKLAGRSASRRTK